MSNLATIVLTDCIRAVANDDKATFNATVSLSMLMACSQIDAIDADKGIDEKLNKRAFVYFLKQFAFRGHMVYRDTQHVVDSIVSIRERAKREVAASDYVTNKGKKLEKPRLVDGLARLRTWSFRLMADVCKNHADIIREVRQMKADGADATAQVERFRRFVVETYGGSFAALSSCLAKDSSPADTRAETVKIIERCAKLDDGDLATVIAALKAEQEKRAEQEKEVAEQFGGDIEDEERLAA